MILGFKSLTLTCFWSPFLLLPLRCVYRTLSQLNCSSRAKVNSILFFVPELPKRVFQRISPADVTPHTRSLLFIFARWKITKLSYDVSHNHWWRYFPLFGLSLFVRCSRCRLLLLKFGSLEKYLPHNSIFVRQSVSYRPHGSLLHHPKGTFSRRFFTSILSANRKLLKLHTFESAAATSQKREIVLHARTL